MPQKVAFINVEFKEQDGFIHARSADVPGLHVVGKFRESVEEDVVPMIRQLYLLNHGLTVRVDQAVDASDFKSPSATDGSLTFWAAPETQLAA